MSSKTPEICYVCGNLAISKEHVPPKALFPKKEDLPKGFNLKKNLITVPSCKEHNNKKSEDDEYFAFVLCTALQGNDLRGKYILPKILRAIQRSPNKYRAFLNEIQPLVVKNKAGLLLPTIAVKPDVEKFNQVLKHVAYGLYFNHFKKPWELELLLVTSDLFIIEEDLHNNLSYHSEVQLLNQNISQSMSNMISLGDNKEIFEYKLIPVDDKKLILHLAFYRDIKFTILFGESF